MKQISCHEPHPFWALNQLHRHSLWEALDHLHQALQLQAGKSKHSNLANFFTPKEGRQIGSGTSSCCRRQNQKLCQNQNLSFRRSKGGSPEGKLRRSSFGARAVLLTGKERGSAPDPSAITGWLPVCLAQRGWNVALQVENVKPLEDFHLEASCFAFILGLMAQ